MGHPRLAQVDLTAVEGEATVVPMVELGIQESAGRPQLELSELRFADVVF